MRLFSVLVCVGVVGVFGFDYARALIDDTPAVIPPAAASRPQGAPRPIKENVVAFATVDPAMNAAKARAKSTLPRFRELMAQGAPGTYTVKFPLTQNGATEHIWLQVSGDRGGAFVGRLANDPVNGAKHKRGDAMTVAAADVEDWMVRSPSAIYGGYTARVALDELPKDKRETLAGLFRD